ncbi:MAG: DoxX family protein [Nitratireductor sp.]|nr:DoxX family protein [Nitratireductor sp.]
MSNNLILLIARILLSVIFILAGVTKFGAIDGNAQYIASVGLPAPTLLAWAAAIFETVAGLFILAGFLTRYTSLALAAFCVFTGFMFHYAPADQMQMVMFMKNLAIAGGFLVLSLAGPGSISVDARRGAASPAFA